MKVRTRNKFLLGWREWVALPDLGVTKIKCKIDTGARTSTLHAYKMERFEEEGKNMIRFVVHPLQRRKRESIQCVCEIIDERNVKDSGGRNEIRPVIMTKLVIGSWSWPIKLTLTNRDQMGFRMLLGRTALKERFIVDPGLSFQAQGNWLVCKTKLINNSEIHFP